MAEVMCRQYDTRLTLVSALSENRAYLDKVAERLKGTGLTVDNRTGKGSVTETVYTLVKETDADLVVTSTRGGSGAWHWLSGGVTPKLIGQIDQPVLVIQSEDGKLPQIKKLLVSLDGSEFSERILPYARALSAAFGAEVLLLAVPEIPEAGRFGVAPDRVEEMRAQAEDQLWTYLNDVAAHTCDDCTAVNLMVTGSYPARTIVRMAEEEAADLIMMSARGRGGLDRLMMGSAAQRVVEQTRLPVFLLPVRDSARGASS